ncbi:flagellar hook-length control protein FliK, partial [Phenylobacterium sp.]|uniref:flagellar hook-length control protein FliK n=1 Tax=Phenylobacterium sp. TaxID=1871053 RepID=UPI00272177A9
TAARPAAPPPAAPQAAPPPHLTAAPPPAALAAAAPPPAPAPGTPASAPVQAEGAEATEATAPLGEPAPAPNSGRGRAATRTARNESGRGEAAATSANAPNVGQAAQSAAAQVEAAATFESGSEGKSEDKAPAVEAKAAADDAAQPAAPGVGDPAAIAAAPGAPAEVRAGPQTVAHLAAQIVKKLEGRSTQFDVALNPEGLGQVDVRIEIGAQGKLTASMSFENAHAAAELRGRAGELQKALEQAGFDVSGGIRFDVAADRGQGQAGQGQFGQDPQNNGGAWRGRAFQAALDSAGETADAALSGALNLQRRTQSGVDVRI